MCLWQCIYNFQRNLDSQKQTVEGQPNNGTNKNVIFKKYVSFTNNISRINKTQVDDAHDIDVVMSMHNLIEYSDNYSETYGILRQYGRDETALNPADSKIDYFTEESAFTDSFKIKEKITGKTGKKMLK